MENSENKKAESSIVVNDESMALILKCHNQVRKISKPLPVEPFSAVNHFVLGKIDTENKADNASALVTTSSFISLGAYLLTFQNNYSPLLLAALTVGAVASFIECSLLISNKPSLGYWLQKGWCKLGLPAKKLKSLERRKAEEWIAYTQDIKKHKKKISRLEKQVSPALRAVNAQSKKYVFAFDENGVRSTLKVPVSEDDVMKNLSREIAYINSPKAIGT